MKPVGETLRRARLDRGLDLAEVAARTRIARRYLEAIESDDRGSLPSGFFYKSFVHQYASVLSVDTAELDAEVDRVLSADAPLPLPGQESQVSKDVAPMALVSRAGRFDLRHALASVAGLIAVVLGCSGVYLWWHQARQAQATPVAQTRTAPPPRTGSTENAKPDPAPAPLVTSHQQQAALNAPGDKVQLDVVATEKTWLSLSSDGKRVFSGTLKPNESKTLEGHEYARLKVGNAAGLEVRLNGRSIGPLGARGQVLTVLFTPGTFQIVAPQKDGA